MTEDKEKEIKKVSLSDLLYINEKNLFSDLVCSRCLFPGYISPLSGESRIMIISLVLQTGSDRNVQVPRLPQTIDKTPL